MTDAMPTVVGKPCDNDICSADIYCRKMSTIVGNSLKFANLRLDVYYRKMSTIVDFVNSSFFPAEDVYCRKMSTVVGHRDDVVVYLVGIYLKNRLL